SPPLPIRKTGKFFWARRNQSVFNLREKPYILFWSHSTDNPQPQLAVLFGAVLRMEFLAIHSAWHQKTGLAGAFFEPANLLRGRSQRSARDPVKPNHRCECCLFRPIVHSLRHLVRKKSNQLAQATSPKLMQVRVPRCHHRNAHLVREIRAKLSKFSGAGYVHHIRAKLRERIPNMVRMPPEKKVVAQIAFDSKTGKTPRQFNARHAAFLNLLAFPSRLKCKKRPRLPPGKIHELARCQSNAINLVKCFAKEGDSWLSVHNPASSLAPSAKRSAGRN